MHPHVVQDGQRRLPSCGRGAGGGGEGDGVDEGLRVGAADLFGLGLIMDGGGERGGQSLVLGWWREFWVWG